VGGPRRRDAAATLQTVIAETDGDEGAVDVTLDTRTGTINADLTVGTDVAGAVALKANEGISNRGVQVIGAGFIVTREEAVRLGLGRVPGIERHIREYRNGKDLTARPRGVMVIDLFGLAEAEVRGRFPEVYQRVHERVKPERETNKRDNYRVNWWIHGEPRKAFRPALEGLPRYIATVETSKHRFFQFLDATVLPDNMLVCIAHDDAYVLGVLSSRIHVTWALAAGSHLGVGNDPVYVKSRCFETFPFPDATEEQKARIRAIADRLDAHRKRQLALHPALTMTEMYNVLDGSRGRSPSISDTETQSMEGERPREPQAPLTPKQRAIHDQGLVTILRQLHDELDAAVVEAYGWGGENVQRSTFNAQRSSMPDAEILERLVELNRQRAAEESRAVVRYLRPAYQRPVAMPAQSDLDLPTNELHHSSLILHPSETLPWPSSLAEQIALVRGVIDQTGWRPDDGEKVLARHFAGVRAPAIRRLVAALSALGHVG
ncbi:MAG: class I SAM-dependent DNA methyltransferase, partial [Kiritimatiellae bacterium]|nr:class I SAM-dependent DNA methyltransferase [Kiritimatiellia bacterium]